MMATNGCPEVLEVLGSSSEDAPSTETPGLSSLNATALRERRQRKKLRLKKLEKRLEILDRQIKKCAEAEVSLDEMNSGYSAYIKEDLLKRKFVKTWQELCELQHVSDSIVIEDREGYEGTPYPEVNRRVQRLLRLDEFPDYMDIVQLLERCNLKHSLSIGTEEKGQLARKVFKDVGKMMKRSRHRDFVHHFGSHLTDTFYTASDPAEQVWHHQLVFRTPMGQNKVAVLIKKDPPNKGHLVLLFRGFTVIKVCRQCVCLFSTGRSSVEDAAGESEGGGEEDGGGGGGVCCETGASARDQWPAESGGRLLLCQRGGGRGG